MSSNYFGRRLKTLDLRFRGEINTEVSELLNQIAENNINSFNQIISEISKENLDNLNWWVKSPASRNTYSSPLFYRLTCLKLLDELIRENKFIYSKILVDSFERCCHRSINHFQQNYF